MRIISTALILFVSVCFASAQDLYDTDNVTLIEITFNDNNWDQTLNDFFAVGAGERLLATVEINGTSFDSVGIRYRGGSTYDASNAKNPLNIKLDHVKNQDYQGFDVLKLSNGAKDPSWMREVLGYEIARNYMEAPKANYASVFVNGNFLGLYANVESVNSKFFSEHFLSDNNNTRFEADPDYDFDEILPAPFGCLEGHGGALENLGPNDVCYFEHYSLQSDTGWDELRALVDMLQNNPDDIRSMMDVDRFMWMSAFNNLIVNLDSYLGPSPRNYYIFKADNGHWVPVIEDLNESFARFPWLSIPAGGDPQPPLQTYTQLNPFQGENDPQKPLLNAFFADATSKRMYVAHLRTMIGDLFTSGWFEERYEDFRNLIDSEVQSDNNHFYTHDQFIQNYSGTVIDSYDGYDAYGFFPLMDGRVSYLLALPEFQAVPPSVNNVGVSPGMPAPGTTVNITASVGNANTVWIGYRNNLKESFQLMDMLDDGNHGDGQAGDGVFGASITTAVGGFQYYIYAENGSAGLFSPERAEFEFHGINTSANVVINEVMASNSTTVADQDGEFDDWVEIYNNSVNTIDLSGWFLTDDLQNLPKWPFPNGVFIDPGSYLTVWVDDDEDQDGLHTSFNLNADGEALAFVMPDGSSVVDQVIFGAQTTDVSYARCPNGIGAFEPLLPTFGTDNSSVCTTGTGGLAQKIGLTVFPNPTKGLLFIETNLQRKTEGRLRSSTGRTVREFSFASSDVVDLSGLPSGLYLLELEGIVQKIVLR